MPEVIIWAVIGAVVAVVVGVAALGLTRLHSLNHRVGSFVCYSRPLTVHADAAGDGAPAGGGSGPVPWSQGIAHYAVGRLDWWRVWSLSPRPARAWDRSELKVLGRKPMDEVVRPDVLVVRCQHRAVTFELAMSRDAYAGMMSWLESAPPRSADSVI